MKSAMKQNGILPALLIVSVMIFSAVFPVFVPGVRATAWDVTTAARTDATFDISSQHGNSAATHATGVAIVDGGSRMYTADWNGMIYRYSLSTAWDISSASYDGVSYDLPQVGSTGLTDIAMNDAGTKLFALEFYDRTIYEYALSTPYDISTASYTGNSRYISEGTNDYNFSVKPDGSRLYVLSDYNDKVLQYSLSTDWDLSSMSYDGTYFAIPNYGDGQRLTMEMAPNGEHLYIRTDGNERIHWHTLSVPWDVSSASYTGEYLSTQSYEPTMNAIFFNPSGSVMLTVGASTRMIYEYSFEDTVAPTITDISSDTTDGSYATGETIDVDVTFSEAVTSTGDVTVTLETGDVDRTCAFSVSNATTGTCDYVVQAGDRTDDLSVKSVSGTIADAAGNPMTDFAPAMNLDANKAIAIDTVTPSISGMSATASDDAATVSWATADEASSRVEYGLTESYGNATSESDTSPRVTSHEVGLADLASCARYFYRVTSEDAEGESASSSGTFATTGCETGEVGDGAEEVVGVAGGEAALDTDEGSVTLSFPADYHTEDATIQINGLSGSSSVPSGLALVDDNLFELLAVVVSNGERLTSFSEPVTFTVFYGSDAEDRFVESTLDVYRYEGGSWVAKDCALDTEADTLTCTLDGFSTYGVFGEESEEEEEEGEGEEKADIDSWTAYLYRTESSCPVKLRLDIEGDHFDKGAVVRIGGTEASRVERRSSHRLVAKFCYEDILDVKTDPERKIRVENPGTDADKAKKRIRIDEVGFRYDSEELGTGTVSGIRAVQSLLIRLGYLDAGLDTGYYGPLTTAAVSRFQAEHGLPQVGVVGPLTREALAIASR